MEVLVIFIGIIALAIDYLIANEFYKIAQMKGFTQQKYLWLPFLFGPIGYMLVIALPDRKGAQINEIDGGELPELSELPEL